MQPLQKCIHGYLGTVRGILGIRAEHFENQWYRPHCFNNDSLSDRKELQVLSRRN